jgi:hypothetical protein
MARRIKFRDAYGQEAVAIFGAKYGEWRVTFLRGRGSYTRTCRSLPMVRRILDANGYEWTEVERG